MTSSTPSAEVGTQSAAVLLVGPNQQENLGLQYLAGMARHAGYRAELVGFNAWQDAHQVVLAVRKRRPLLVGLGMAFQHAVGDYLALATLLRQHGFRGHLTAGGHVATFCWQELLQACPALDSVVLHDGEHTLVDLLSKLERGESATNVAGCAWREAKTPVRGPRRAVEANLDRLPHPERAATPYLVAGIPIAFVLTARGCIGECSYCCIRAFATDSGGPRIRLRSAAAVGEELGALVRRDVRMVFIQDDLFILPEARRAVARMDAIHAACQRHGASQLGFWIKGRPESITPDVLDAAQRLGAIHVFLGVESPVAERLAYLGRQHRPEHNRRALQLCQARGLHPSFNLMLFDPESTLEHVAQAADFAHEHLDVPWNVCRTEIYPGTELFTRLRAQGRLHGDFHGWGYRIRDTRAELAFRLLRVCLHERAFAADSLHNKLISLAFAAQAHQWMFPGGQTDTVAKQANAIGRAVRLDTVDIIRRTLDFAARVDPGDRRAANTFALREGTAAAQRELANHAQAERLWDLMHARGRLLLRDASTARRRPGTKATS